MLELTPDQLELILLCDKQIAGLNEELGSLDYFINDQSIRIRREKQLLDCLKDRYESRHRLLLRIFENADYSEEYLKEKEASAL